MPLTNQHRKQITAAYCVLFYLLMLHKLYNGFLLFQIQPHLFGVRFDMVTWMLMETGVHRWLLDNSTGWLIFDAVFYVMPLLYFIIFIKRQNLAPFVAAVMLLVNWIYIECYTLYPANSIESFTPWLLFPFLFLTANINQFYFVLHGLRFFFIFFFASSGVWKITQGGVFYPGQMSGVLLFQHKEYLVTSKDWYTRFVYFLVRRPQLSFVLYVGAAMLELFFFVGFFTRRYDKFLIVLFIVFLLLDNLFMRIPYWEVTPFFITLVFSKFTQPSATTLR